MLEAMKSVRDEMLSFKKASKSYVVKASDSTQAGPQPRTSNQPDPIPTWTSNPVTSDHSDVQPMDSEHYGSPLPPKSFQNVHSEHASKQSDVESHHHSERCSESNHRQVVPPYKTKKQSDQRKYKSRAKHYSQSSSSEEDESSVLTKSLHNLNRRFIKNLNIRTAQIQSLIGR